MTGLLKRRQNLLKDATSDLDCMKNELLKHQARLLEVQDELLEKKCQQLETLNITVKEKLADWSSIVKNTNQIVDRKKEVKKQQRLLCMKVTMSLMLLCSMLKKRVKMEIPVKL